MNLLKTPIRAYAFGKKGMVLFRLIGKGMVLAHTHSELGECAQINFPSEASNQLAERIAMSESQLSLLKALLKVGTTGRSVRAPELEL